MLVSVHQEILLISLIDFQSNTNLFLKFLLSNFIYLFFFKSFTCLFMHKAFKQHHTMPLFLR